MRYLILLLIFLFFSSNAKAAVRARTIEYRHGEILLEGYLAYDDSFKGKRPGVLIVHEWKGIGAYERMRASRIAELGYVAFVLDMYGKGVRPKNEEEAAQQATSYRSDRPLMRERAAAGLETLKKQANVDREKIAAIGYCFGGGVALELARSGADIKGAVSFHGNLDTPDPADAKNIKAKVLVLHGGRDPLVPHDQVLAFENEMLDANVDWQLNVYGNAVHSFTNQASGNDPSTGIAYNAQADQRSWQAMQVFFKELFKG